MDISEFTAKASPDQTKKALEEFLTAYMNPSFGTLPKTELELIVLRLLAQIGAVPERPTVYELISGLKVTRSKARRLIYEQELRTRTPKELDEDIRRILRRPILQKRGDSFALEIENPLLSDHIRAKLKTLSWLSVMQHYGVPTRLIDFTTSPYIALYFALETYNPLSQHDFAVYAIDYTAVMEASIQHIKKVDLKFTETRFSHNGKQDVIFDEVVDRYAYDIAWVTEPKELNARIDRQSGTFLVSGNLENTIESVMNLPLYENATVLKIRVPAFLYEGVYVALRKMSINAKSIYGDLGGLAKSIRMELQAHTQ